MHCLEIPLTGESAKPLIVYTVGLCVFGKLQDHVQY